MRAAILAVVLAMSSVAHADPDDKNPNVALGLSGLTTLGGAVVAGLAPDMPHNSTLRYGFAVTGISAILIGPSLGHIYAGRVFNGWFVMRAAGSMVCGALLYDDYREDTFSNIAYAVLGCVVGGGFAVVGTIGDIATAPNAAIEHNKTVRLSPVVVTDRGLTPGLALGGSF